MSKKDIYFMLIPNSAEILKDKLQSMLQWRSAETINKTKDALSSDKFCRCI